MPGFNWETRIVDEDGKDVPRGEPGELIVRGDGVMREYYRNPEATAKALKDGWLYTGDMVRMDEDGFIWIVDRKKDVIITGGENVFPVEVEDFFHTTPERQGRGGDRAARRAPGRDRRGHHRGGSGEDPDRGRGNQVL